MKTQKTPSYQNNLEKEQSWKNHVNSAYITKLQQSKKYGTSSKSYTQIKNSEINSCTYYQLIYNNRGKNIQWRKDSLSISGAGKTGQQHRKK